MYGDEFLANSRPGIDVQSIVFTDEKFFRVEQDDRQQRVVAGQRDDEEGAPSSTLVSNPRVETSTGFCVHCGAFFSEEVAASVSCHCFGVAMLQASWSQRVFVGRQRHSSWRRSLSKTRARSTAAFAVAFLENSYAPVMSLIPAPVVWHEDNAPSHRSKATRDWKKANFQYPGPWLASTVFRPGPDGLQHLAGRGLSAYPAERFSSKAALKAAIARAFAVVAASDAPGKAFSAFKNRLQQCLDADGGHFEALVFTDVAFLVRVKKII